VPSDLHVLSEEELNLSKYFNSIPVIIQTLLLVRTEAW
jgi:hypothetical protein